MLFIRITLQNYKILAKERNNEVEKCLVASMELLVVILSHSYCYAF